SHRRHGDVATFDSPQPIYSTTLSTADYCHIFVGDFLEELENRVDVLTLSNNGGGRRRAISRCPWCTEEVGGSLDGGNKGLHGHDNCNVEDLDRIKQIFLRRG
ncbi:WD-repeat 1, partial [Striga asiatica]